MAKHLFKLRRGTKEQWAKYEEDDNHLRPQAGELVVEFDGDIPRLKLGDGKKKFSELPYISVASFVFPEPPSVTLKATDWTEAKDEDGNVIYNRYYQDNVIVDNAKITPYSKVDLQPSPEDLLIFYEKDIAFTTVNEDGKIRVCLIGQKPTRDYTIQVTATEVLTNG